MAESDWPSLQSELARKALDTIRDKAIKNAEGTVSCRALALIADTICDLTQGLIPQGDWALIYSVRQEMLNQCQREAT